jgi:hypothetical protein
MAVKLTGSSAARLLRYLMKIIPRDWKWTRISVDSRSGIHVVRSVLLFDEQRHIPKVWDGQPVTFETLNKPN